MPQFNSPPVPHSSKSHVTFTFSGVLTDADVENLKMAMKARNAFLVPAIVQAALDRQQQLQFKQSSEPEVGRLLSVFAAMVPSHGRILELGTGAGVGLAWIVHGLNHRNDVEVVSVELHREQAVLVKAAEWPDWVSIVIGDSGELLSTLGSFDLIFPDTPRGKIYNLEKTITALRPGGVLLLDDMETREDETPERLARIASVRNQLFGNPNLICTELALSSGVIMAARQRL